MAAYDFDLFTLGAGSGGVAGSRRAAIYGARVGIAESVRVGGTCVLRGCVPKKLLVYAAHFADDFADAAGYGWTVPEPSFDWPALIERKNRELDRLNGIYLKLLADTGVKLFEGRARLLDAHTIEIGPTRVTAERIMIATGGHPVLPAVPGIKHAITSNEALDLPQLPRRIVIVGGGYIAVEFAGIFHALGVEVTLLCRSDGVLRGFDEDVRTTLLQELRGRGIAVRTGTNVTKIQKTAPGIALTTLQGDEIATDIVMYATGRAPNTRGLGLEELGILLNENGAILVDEWSETAVPGIYAVGDATDRINLTPVAIAEARALAETHFNANPTKFDRMCVPSAVFSSPPVATVGLTEEEARRCLSAVDIYRTRFRPMKHTLSGREERVMMKLVVERASDKVVGCHMVGPDAAEIIQGVAIAVKCGATKRQFDQTVGIHPTTAEEFVTMREKLPEPVSKAAE
ncbi:MAG: glutathione-disulfide reductase [Aliidongia sp.]